MSKALKEAIKAKFKTPREAIIALGLDESLIEEKAKDEEEEGEKKKAEDADTPENFLKSKMSEDDFAEYKKMCDAKDKAKDSEEEDDPEDKGKKPPLGSKKATDKGRDALPEEFKKKEKAEDEDDPRAMDEKIRDAVQAERTRIRGVAEAEKFIRPWVGELLVAMDSAEDVYKRALTMQGVKGLDKIHPSAYRALLEAQPKPGARNRDHHTGTGAMGMDSSSRETAVKYAPGLERIRIGA